jgi:biopolymer transport protein ExbD
MGKKKRKVPQMNATSSADIAFMLLLFFLLTTSMDTDTGLARRLPPPPDKSMQREQSDIKVNKRNILTVMINTNNQVLCGGEYIDIRQLREITKTFLQNEARSEHLPEYEDKDVPYFGNMSVLTEKHVVSLQNDRCTSYQAYIDVQNELVAAYNELRNEVSRAKWGKLFDELNEDQQKAVQMIYPQKISEAEPKNYGDRK